LLQRKESSLRKGVTASVTREGGALWCQRYLRVVGSYVDPDRRKHWL